MKKEGKIIRTALAVVLFLAVTMLGTGVVLALDNCNQCSSCCNSCQSQCDTCKSNCQFGSGCISGYCDSGDCFSICVGCMGCTNCEDTYWCTVACESVKASDCSDCEDDCRATCDNCKDNWCWCPGGCSGPGPCPCAGYGCY